MRKFIIVTDSCSDLNNALREEYQIEYIPMHFSCDEVEYYADLDWKKLSEKEFYDLMRSGKRIITSQINVSEYEERFKKYIDEGFDILSISCSSALSSSVKASYVARDELLKTNENAKIICIDSLNSCYGLGLLCIIASKLRDDGKTIEEVASYIESIKLKINQEATVESLKYLKQAGRVSAASAFFGGLLNIKPIIISDAIGQNFAVEKVKGRKTSFIRIAERIKDEYESHQFQRVFIGHGDCIEDCQALKEEVEKVLPEDVEITTGYIGPIVGASCGPGVLGVYFIGKEVEINK